MNNTELNSISSIKNLGITLTHNLNFQEHIERTVKKSLRVLGYVKRHSSEFKNVDSLKLFYCVLVRCILEYRSPIWIPYTNSNIEIIEGVQKRFLSFAAYKSNTTINQHDYTSIRSLLKLPSLASRRDLADLYKLINNHIDAPYLLEHISFNIPAYNNRTTPIFYLPSHSTNYLKKNSHFLKAMTLCNKLASNIDCFFTPLASILKTYFTNNSFHFSLYS